MCGDPNTSKPSDIPELPPASKPKCENMETSSVGGSDTASWVTDKEEQDKRKLCDTPNGGIEHCLVTVKQEDEDVVDQLNIIVKQEDEDMVDQLNTEQESHTVIPNEAMDPANVTAKQEYDSTEGLGEGCKEIVAQELEDSTAIVKQEGDTADWPTAEQSGKVCSPVILNEPKAHFKMIFKEERCDTDSVGQEENTEFCEVWINDQQGCEEGQNSNTPRNEPLEYSSIYVKQEYG